MTKSALVELPPAPSVDDVLAAASPMLRDVLRLCFPDDAARHLAITNARAATVKLCSELPDPSDAADFAEAARFGDCLIGRLRDSMGCDAQRRFDALDCRAFLLKSATRHVRHEWSRATREGGLRLTLGHARGDLFAYVDSRPVLRITWAEDRRLVAESVQGDFECLNPAVDPE